MADRLVDRPRRAAARLLALPPEGRLAPALIGVALLSGGLLGGALFFQYVQGLPPCKLCIVQRYPHGAALALAGLALGLGLARLAPARLADLRAMLLGAAALALTVTGGYGIHHAGVEQGWWPGPSGCTGAALPDSLAALNAMAEKGERIVNCGEIPWSFLGVSMAGWNAMLSLAGAFLVLSVLLSYLRARAGPARAAQHG